MSTNEALFLKDSQFLHHAFGVEGNPETALPWVREHLALGPDLSVYASEQCDIETVRMVRSRGEEGGFSGLRAFVISAYRFTHEAQNALLKMTEEPIRGTAFFLIVPRISHFIPTLRSRLRVVQTPHGSTFGPQIDEFLRAPIPERLKMIEALIEGHDEHGEKRIVAEKFDRFTRELSHALHARRTGEGVRESEREILFVREYIYDTAASLRMLAEHLAMSLPLC